MFYSEEQECDVATLNSVLFENLFKHTISAHPTFQRIVQIVQMALYKELTKEILNAECVVEYFVQIWTYLGFWTLSTMSKVIIQHRVKIHKKMMRFHTQLQFNHSKIT